MRDSPSFPLRLVCALLFLVLLAGSAGAGLTVVHLNQEKTRLAADTVKYKVQLEETDQRLQEAEADVAQAQEPETLKARIGNRLTLMQDRQIVWVRAAAGLPPSEATPASAPTFNFRFAADHPANSTQLTQ